MNPISRTAEGKLLTQSTHTIIEVFRSIWVLIHLSLIWQCPLGIHNFQRSLWILLKLNTIIHNVFFPAKIRDTWIRTEIHSCIFQWGISLIRMFSQLLGRTFRYLHTVGRVCYCQFIRYCLGLKIKVFRTGSSMLTFEYVIL